MIQIVGYTRIQTTPDRTLSAFLCLELPHCLNFVEQGLESVVVDFDETEKELVRLDGCGDA